MEKKTQANAVDTASFQKDKYVKEVPDFKMDDNKSEVAIMKDFYTLIYGFIAQRVIDSFGAEGESRWSEERCVISVRSAAPPSGKDSFTMAWS